MKWEPSDEQIAEIEQYMKERMMKQLEEEFNEVADGKEGKDREATPQDPRLD